MAAPGSRHVTIAPSLLAADFGRRREEAAAIEPAGAEWLHPGIMDGHVVSSLDAGPSVLAALRKQTKLAVDVYLMIASVGMYFDASITAGADQLYPGAGPHLHRVAATHPRAGEKGRDGA